MKAIIESGGKQYIVEKGDRIKIELIGDKKEVEFMATAKIDGKDSDYKKGNLKVIGKVIDEIKEDKVTSIRYKAKKRVNKVRGHRQDKSVIEITSIA